MLKKTSFYISTLVLGIALIALSFAFQGEEVKNIAGVLIGIGAGLFGMSLSNLLMKRIEQKNPEIVKQKEVELKDERNEMIRNRAKARSGDIIQWFIIGLAFVMILLNSSLCLILISVGIFLLYHVISICFMSKFQKEM